MNNQERVEYVQQIQDTKDNFYETHKKNWLFKNKQKLECSETLTRELDLVKMVQCTIFQVPNTNIIYYNYLVFKTYANEKTKDYVYNHMIELVHNILQVYPTFEFHINLKTFTISAAHRYYSLITSTFDENKIFTKQLTKLKIYHTPSIISQLTSLFHNQVKDIIGIVEYCYKDSDQKIAKLFEHVEKSI